MLHPAHVMHHIPGRMRVKVPHAKGNYQLLQQIQQSISPLPGITRVEISPATGSVLVHYDPDQHADFNNHLAAHAERAELFVLQPPGLTEVDAITAKIEAEAELLAQHSETARSIVNFMKQLNERTKLATDNTVDLNVLLPLGLAIYTFLEVGSEAMTPLWVTLGIFSFNSFIVLHDSRPTVQVDAQKFKVGKSQERQTAPHKAARAKAIRARRRG
jgi:Heavy metal associated domain 2